MASIEQGIQKKIIKLLESEYDAYTVKVIQASKNGVPDLISCIPFTKEQAMNHFKTNETLGVFLAIEVKTPTTTTNTSPLQKYNLQKVKDCGGLQQVSWSPEMTKDFLKDSHVK